MRARQLFHAEGQPLPAPLLQRRLQLAAAQSRAPRPDEHPPPRRAPCCGHAPRSGCGSGLRWRCPWTAGGTSWGGHGGRRPGGALRAVRRACRCPVRAAAPVAPVRRAGARAGLRLLSHFARCARVSLAASTPSAVAPASAASRRPGDPRPLHALLDGRGLCANASAAGRPSPYLLPAPPAPGELPAPDALAEQNRAKVRGGAPSWLFRPKGCTWES